MGEFVLVKNRKLCVLEVYKIKLFCCLPTSMIWNIVFFSLPFGGIQMTILLISVSLFYTDITLKKKLNPRNHQIGKTFNY